MVEYVCINEEQRHVKRLEFRDKIRSLRSCVFSIPLLVLFLFYYIDPYVLTETWALTVGFLSETFIISNESQSLRLSDQYYVNYPQKYHFVTNEPEKCRKENTFVVLMVPVASGNTAARDAIRATWGTEKLVENKVVSMFFLLGSSSSEKNTKVKKQLLEESTRYHDILQCDFLDTYHNLTIKTMVMLEWLARYCQNASYAMKVDSDIFLNVNNLVKMLLSAPTENYMTGLVTRAGRVLRDPRSKWYLPKTVYTPALYPPYALGLGYVLSLDLPKKLVEAAKRVKAVYIEDVYLGMCMKHLGISPTYPSRNDLFHVFPVKYNRCRYSKLIATTTRSLRDQVEFWKDLQKPQRPC
ncbi:beta-1,3-galactosyltransferase 2-like [Triplophysa dalaica]|uniref:beta-1,3-galactosyltransferase 2-like n=1 Tax=Triplophysa dalaica TaxID=1582913 RepID=UPI0024E031B3|nr:beta-1,3-galactosyltransferase 2-like [Triplophysa dalaica]